MPTTTELTMSHRVAYGWSQHADYSSLAEATAAAEALAATPQSDPSCREVALLDLLSGSPYRVLREYERPAS